MMQIDTLIPHHKHDACTDHYSTANPNYCKLLQLLQTTSPTLSNLSLLYPFLCAGYELLYQPDVVRIYTSLLKESKNPSVLEAAAGAVQNLCAGRWSVSVSSSLFLCVSVCEL